MRHGGIGFAPGFSVTMTMPRLLGPLHPFAVHQVTGSLKALLLKPLPLPRIRMSARRSRCVRASGGDASSQPRQAPPCAEKNSTTTHQLHLAAFVMASHNAHSDRPALGRLTHLDPEGFRHRRRRYRRPSRRDGANGCGSRCSHSVSGPGRRTQHVSRQP